MFLVKPMLRTGKKTDKRRREEKKQDGERRQDFFEEREATRRAGEGVAVVRVYVGVRRDALAGGIQQGRCLCGDVSAPGIRKAGESGLTLVCRGSCGHVDGWKGKARRHEPPHARSMYTRGLTDHARRDDESAETGQARPESSKR